MHYSTEVFTYPNLQISVKKMLISLFLLWLPLAGFSQSEYHARLPITGSVSELGISPSGEIWVGTRAGAVYYTKGIGSLWHFGPFTSKEDASLSSSGSFDRVSFFSEDTMMISGFIHGESGNQDFVYRSTDHGKTWDKVKFGRSSWNDAAHVSRDGKAWMSGSSQLIYYSEDYGRTWKSFPKVEAEGNLRFSTIHFAADGKTGLFGSFYNVIYRTPDNCKTWQKLPTPLSQSKYVRLSKHDRPDIRKVRMFGNYYIVDQQGRIFITRSDTVDWRRLDDAVDFEVTEKQTLYLVKKDHSVELYDSSFTQKWKSGERMIGSPTAMAVHGGSLYALTHGTAYKISPKEFIESDLLTDKVPIQEPYAKVNYRDNRYGYDGYDILRYDSQGKRWYRFMTPDFGVGNMVVYRDRLLLSDASLRRYFSIEEGRKVVETYALPKSLFATSLNSITEFHIESGSQGCFHADNSRRTYIRKGGEFVVDRKVSTPGFLERMPNQIGTDHLRRMAGEIDHSLSTPLTVADLGIAGKDIAEYKALISREEKRITEKGIDRFPSENLYSFPGENADFGFYRGVADSLHKLPDAVINEVFHTDYGNWSTTTSWKRVVFVFEDGKKVIVESSSDKPSYLYAPWTVDYEGLRFKSNSLGFGRMISEVTKGGFFIEGVEEKQYALFKIADFLYRKEIKGNQ